MNFNFGSVLNELEKKAPTLVSIFRSCTKSLTPRSNCDQVTALLIGVICKHRRPQFCQIQRLVSWILYAGYSSKQVSTFKLTFTFIILPRISGVDLRQVSNFLTTFIKWKVQYVLLSLMSNILITHFHLLTLFHMISH